MTRPLFDILASSCAAMATPAAAQDTQTSGRNVVIGAGIEVVPKYPGASSGRSGVLPLFDTWRADAPRPAQRLRGELRHGIGGHRALTGDLGADAVWRGAGDGITLTIGPRMRWGSGKYNRAFFSVPAANGAGFAPFDAGPGIYSYGAAAGLRVPLSQRFGLYTYARYDRLSGRVAASPIVVAGSADQFSGGLALTHRFGI